MSLFKVHVTSKALKRLISLICFQTITSYLTLFCLLLIHVFFFGLFYIMYIFLFFFSRILFYSSILSLPQSSSSSIFFRIFSPQPFIIFHMVFSFVFFHSCFSRVLFFFFFSFISLLLSLLLFI